MQRQQHRQEVLGFLQVHFSGASWRLTLLGGAGHETYFAYSEASSLFIKLGARLANYQTMAAIGLTPPVLAAGFLEDGVSLLIQPLIAGRKPTRRDFREHLARIARIVAAAHGSQEVVAALPEIPSDQYRDIGLEALERVRQKWERCKAQAPGVSAFVEDGLAQLAGQVQDFCGAGSVASHNDICNANWLIAKDGNIYLVDLDSMSREDPATDLGALLWWYYPPEQRPKFLEITGHAAEEQFEMRMRVRMALHCLNILLPREGSFDRFDAGAFAGALVDFRAAMAGKENPQGYSA